MSDPIHVETSIESESHHSGDSVGADPSGFSGGVEPSAKLNARIKKLSHWKLDPSSITSAKGTHEFCGGHAIGSKARMNTQGMDLQGMKKRTLGNKLNSRAREHFLRNRESIQKHKEMDVAIKKMRIADNTDFERALGLAIREAEFMTEFDHSNIIGFYGFVEDVSKGIIWPVFPWAENGNLKDFVALVNWEIPEKISLINDVAQGLAYLHSRKPPICHGDLKSLNVLVNHACRAAITDFGAARRISRRHANRQTKQVESQLCSAQPLSAAFCASTNTITLTGNKYTLRWAAPELLMEDQLSLRSDIWALGWIAYEVMTKSLPFEDVTSEAVIVERVLNGKLPSPADNIYLSWVDELCSLMNMCWRSNPAERPTADSCRESIKQMPMFAPEIGTFGTKDRVLTIEHLKHVGHMHQSRGEDAKAFDYFAEALEASRMYGDAEQLLSSLLDIAQLHRLRTEYDESIRLYSEAVAIWTDLGERGCRASGLRDIARVHWLQSEYDKAILLYSEALEIYTDLGNRKGRGDTLYCLADLHRLRGEYDEAIPLYTKALKIYTNLGDRAGRADVIAGLADAHRCRGEFDRAISLYTDALKIHTNLGDREGRTDATRGLADALRGRGEYDEDTSPWTGILAICTKLGDGEGRAGAIARLADVHRRRGGYDEAISLYTDALAICANRGDREGKADAFARQADVYRHQGAYGMSIRRYTAALKIYTNLGDEEGRANATAGLAEVWRCLRKYDEAVLLYTETFKIWTDLGDRDRRVEALCSLAGIHWLRGEHGEATRLYSEASEIVAEQAGNT